MSEQNAGNNGALITLDGVKSKISIGLTKQNLLIQSFHTRKSELVLNEDHENVEMVKSFLSDKKEAEKIITEQHKIIKNPYWMACKAADGAKNEMIELLNDATDSVGAWYQNYCNEQDRKKREQEERIAKELQIKAGVEANILDFSTKIAACKTKKELTDIERLINLEKSSSRANKYGDLHNFAISRYDEVLLPIIKDQKPKVDEYEKLQEQLLKASNPVLADQLKEQLEQKENEILQNQVRVQEEALKQQEIPSIEAEEIIPDVTKAGSNMVCEIVDEKIVFKKHRELLNIDLRLVETKKLGATLRDAGAFNGKDELIFDGIKFKIEKKWKV